LPGSVAIVGGGYAGMAAAVELAGRGIPVVVYEAAAQLGGRARAVPHRGLALDNGLHILIGAYTETLRLIRHVGVDPDRALLRCPLDWRLLPDFRVRALSLPAPLDLAGGLLLARGAGLGEKLSCLRFLQRLQANRFRLDADTSLADLLEAHGQRGSFVDRLWRPLCLAALNTPPEDASAQVFLNVMRDGLAAGRDASNLLLPRVDLTALFPGPAAQFVERRGGKVLCSTTVRAIASVPGGFNVVTPGGAREHAQVICAVQPSRLDALTQALPELDPVRSCVAAFRYEPITSVYLQYERAPAFPAPMIGFAQGCSQWAFDRGRLAGQSGLVGVVISAGGPHRALTNDALAARVHEEIAGHLDVASQAPMWSRVIEEKRATFACVPALVRPDQATNLRGFHLAGDYTRSDHPATLEAAVRSGLQCASRVAAQRMNTPSA